MIIFYVDESGTGLGDSKSPYFVLAGIGISTKNLSEINRAFTGLKQQLINWLDPEDWELKGRDLRRGEGVFKSQNWEQRVSTFMEVAHLLNRIPSKIFAVQVDKKSLPENIETDPQLYRLSIRELLEVLQRDLEYFQEEGILLFDTRSELHTSIQDRRVVDAFCNWRDRQAETPSRFCELPLFGFSAFYPGLQLADFVSYLIDFNTNEIHRETRRIELQEAFHVLENKIQFIRLP